MSRLASFRTSRMFWVLVTAILALGVFAPTASAADLSVVSATGAAIPVASTGAYLGAGGIGVSSIEASVAFYKALGMTETARVTRADREEVVLDSADRRGSQLVLFHFSDGRTADYRRNNGKVVFYVRDAGAFAAALTAAGGRITLPPSPYGATGIVVGFGRDPDNNLVEIAQLPSTSDSAAKAHSYISAFGVGVSDLKSARDFYVNTLDMREGQFLSVNRPVSATASAPWYDEYILVSKSGKGSAIVLMHFTDGAPRDYADTPVKLALRVDDPAAYAKAIAGAGAGVIRSPAPEAALGGTVVGFAKDADGTVLEILPASNP